MQFLVDLLGCLVDALVVREDQTFNVLFQSLNSILLQLYLVLHLNQGPVDALEHSFYDWLSVDIQSLDQELHVMLHKVDLAGLLRLLGVELEQLDQTVGRFVHNLHFVVERKQLNDKVEVLVERLASPGTASFVSLNLKDKVCKEVLNDF